MKTGNYLMLAAIGAFLTAQPAEAFRGGFGGFGGGGGHVGGFDDSHAGGFVARGPDGGEVAGWHSGGTAGAGGTWHADGYHGGDSWGGYHGPVVVNSYYGGGCFNCGAGAAVAGAAIAGAAVGAATAASMENRYIVGATFATLPTGCAYRFMNGEAFYVCGNAWLAPQYGNNGVHYVVVPPM